MTIRELEARCGLDRATIRYYEKEGLLAPVRQANGYRDYSEEDALALDKIALLRQLGLSLEMIRAVQRGELPLGVALEKQSDTLLQQREETDRALQISRILREEGVSYQTLQPEKYRLQLQPPQWEPRVIPPEQPKKHYATGHPWRRLFARSLDMWLYALPWIALRTWLGLTNWAFWLGEFFSIMVLTLLLESLLLSAWGTTPGKWLMGLRLRRHYTEEFGKPAFRDALYRTFQVYLMGWGLGLGLPQLLCLAFAFLRANRGDDQPWDDLWEYTADEECSGGRIAMVLAALTGFALLSNRADDLWIDRANARAEARYLAQQELRAPTVEEFVNNVNAVLAEHRDLADFRHVSLNVDGTWNNLEADTSAFDLTITEVDGKFHSATATAVFPGDQTGTRPDGVELYYAVMLGLYQSLGHDVGGMTAHTEAESYRDGYSGKGPWGASYDMEPDEKELEQTFILTKDGFLPRGRREIPDLKITLSVGKIENPYADWYDGEAGK